MSHMVKYCDLISCSLDILWNFCLFQEKIIYSIVNPNSYFNLSEKAELVISFELVS